MEGMSKDCSYRISCGYAAVTPVTLDEIAGLLGLRRNSRKLRELFDNVRDGINVARCRFVAVLMGTLGRITHVESVGRPGRSPRLGVKRRCMRCARRAMPNGPAPVSGTSPTIFAPKRSAKSAKSPSR